MLRHLKGLTGQFPFRMVMLLAKFSERRILWFIRLLDKALDKHFYASIHQAEFLVEGLFAYVRILVLAVWTDHLVTDPAPHIVRLRLDFLPTKVVVTQWILLLIESFNAFSILVLQG